MSEIVSVPARRLRRPSWRDPRLGVGVVLVLLSVLLGSSVVAAADDTTAVWAATRTLTAGDAVGPRDVHVVQVRVEAEDELYLPASNDLPSGLVALRTVGAGELLPRSGVGDVADAAARPVGVPVEGALPAGMVKGAHVDVWVAEPDPARAGSFHAPERLVEAAEVAEVSSGGGALGTSSGTTVQVLVAQERLPSVLGALANGAAVSLVLLPGSGPADS